MMTEAMHTLRKMVGTAFFSRISSTAATKAPFQAPVPGSGIAENRGVGWQPQPLQQGAIPDILGVLRPPIDDIIGWHPE